MVDPLSYFSFQPVPHDWCNKSHGMCYPVSGNEIAFFFSFFVLMVQCRSSIYRGKVLRMNRHFQTIFVSFRLDLLSDKTGTLRAVSVQA